MHPVPTPRKVAWSVHERITRSGGVSIRPGCGKKPIGEQFFRDPKPLSEEADSFLAATEQAMCHRRDA